MLPGEDLLQDLLAVLCSTGADWAEVFIQRSSFTRLSREDGRAGDASFAEDRGVALRLSSGGRQGLASVSGFEPDELLSTARHAAAEYAAGAPRPPVPLRRLPARGLNPVLLAPEGVPAARKAALLEEAHQAAAGDGAVKFSALYRDSTHDVMVATSEGTLTRERRAYLTLYVQAHAEDRARTRAGARVLSAAAGFEYFEGGPHRSAALEASATARRLLSAVPTPSGDLPVVFAPTAAGLFIHETVGHALEGVLGLQSAAPLYGRPGERIAPAAFSLVDDGAAPGRRGTCDYDDEGCPTGRVLLVEEGVLRGVLTDRASAAALHLPRTGSGRRESFRHRPAARMRNTLVLPSTRAPGDLVGSIAFGFYVVQMGGGRVDPASGDFDFTVTEGRIIREGVLAETVEGALLSGNGPGVLASLVGVGSDLAYGVGTSARDGQSVPVSDGAPTLLVGSLQVRPWEG